MHRYLENNNISIEMKRNFFSGIILNTILDKEIFRKNEELKKYISLYENFEEIEEYRPYLYKSRTLLVARLLKDVKFNLNDQQFKELIDLHYQFMKSEDTKSKNDFKKPEKEHIKKEKKNQQSVLENYLAARRRNNDDI